MGNRRDKRTNEKIYPICFFILLPLIGFFAAYEHNFMDGNTSNGMLVGLLAGAGCYLFYKLFGR